MAKKYERGYVVDFTDAIYQIDAGTFCQFYANEFRKIYALIGYAQINKDKHVDELICEMEYLGKQPPNSFLLEMSYVNEGVRYVRDHLFVMEGSGKVYRYISGAMLRKLAYKKKTRCCAIPIDADHIAEVILKHVFEEFHDSRIQTVFFESIYRDCLSCCKKRKYRPDTVHVCRKLFFDFHIDMLMRKADNSKRAKSLLRELLEIPEINSIASRIEKTRSAENNI